jgi:hypothetical protein
LRPSENCGERSALDDGVGQEADSIDEVRRSRRADAKQVSDRALREQVINRQVNSIDFLDIGNRMVTITKWLH